VNFKAYTSKTRGETRHTVELNPIFKNNGKLNKVLSFSVSYHKNVSKKTESKINQLQHSVLKNGQWYRFAIDTTGVYKLNKSFFESLGINTGTLNPKTIKIYGHGGQSLPLQNSQTVSFDMIENAVKFVGENDGVFDSEDYLLFYAIGPKGYNSDNNSHINPYSDEAYYYVNISTGNGLRMEPSASPTAEPDVNFTTFHDYKFIESDEYNVGQMGRRWFGHRFYFENARSFQFEFPNLVTSSPLQLSVYGVATSESSTSLEVKVNGTTIDNLSFAGIEYGILATQDGFSSNFNSTSSIVTVDLNFNNQGNPSASAYLDYISIEAERELIGDGSQFQFKHNDMSILSGVGQFTLDSASSIGEIWNITDPYNPSYYTNTDLNATFSFKTALGSQKIFQAVSISDYYSPRLLSNNSVTNQDIKGTIFLDSQGQFKDVDYLIITPKFLESQAQRLANINENQSNLTVKVVTLESIYQEFSSGMQDISGIRNFVKYVYDNASMDSKRLRYVCLFGDASFDYKNRISNNTNIAPSWLSLNSFSLTNSFISDDFYGMMDDNEGGMLNSDKLDIAIGRILAETPQRAREMVDKIESYYSSEAYGSWRNNYLLISDDVDKLSDRLLQQTTDQIAEEVKQSKPFLNVQKIHADAFTQETSAGGSRYPQVNKAIFDALEVGAVAVNYFGHGGEDGLALERIFDKINAQELNNPNKLNCFVTVTCEYTKFDNPLRKTAGEYLYWNTKGGAISLITTTRQIFISAGIQFNTTLGQYLFDYNNTQNITIAEALRLTKTDPAVTNNTQRRLVFYIGDPALKLPLADPDIVTTKINNEPISNTNVTLQALSPAKIEGYVADQNGSILDNYNGTITATIYDKDIQRSTLGNDGTTLDNQLIILNYNALGEVIFRGQATVENGLFEINFIVPRDITVPIGNGKISLYSKTENPLSDQRGYSFDITIGGVNTNAPEDNKGPDIQLFMNDESFVSGGITNENPTLIAKLFDENGINTASGVGHDIAATLDGDETKPFILNDYYVADLNTYKSGQLSYPLRDLSPGMHTLTLKAWDVYNNSSTKDIQFIVFDQNQSLELTNVLNYPNPFINHTEFWFSHNSSGILDVSIQIFTISGKLIKTINSQTNNNGSSSVSREISWDGTDDFGHKIGKGVYIYKLNVKSTTNGLKSEKIEKLVIL
ncbi:MAG: type IX secretion system sortase PorU, partial [Flavobacteriaceae bacterium]